MIKRNNDALPINCVNKNNNGIRADAVLVVSQKDGEKRKTKAGNYTDTMR